MTRPPRLVQNPTISANPMTEEAMLENFRRMYAGFLADGLTLSGSDGVYKVNLGPGLTVDPNSGGIIIDWGAAINQMALNGSVAAQGGGGGGGEPPNALLDGHVHSDTIAHAPAAGDLVYADGTGKWDGLGVGAAADILTVVGGLPAWFTHGADQDLLMMNGGGSLGWFSKGANESILVTQAGNLGWFGPGNNGDMLTVQAGALAWTPAPAAPSGATGGFVAVVGLRVDGNDLQAQTQSVTVENGLITEIGDVSDWFTWHTGTDCSGGE
jgi:hypothetical protein